MGDEQDAVLDEGREGEPELAVDDVLGGALGILELPLIDSTEGKVQDKKANEAIINNNN